MVQGIVVDDTGDGDVTISWSTTNECGNATRYHVQYYQVDETGVPVGQIMNLNVESLPFKLSDKLDPGARYTIEVSKTTQSHLTAWNMQNFDDLFSFFMMFNSL